MDAHVEKDPQGVYLQSLQAELKDCQAPGSKRHADKEAVEAEIARVKKEIAAASKADAKDS
jgi:hypothetical protein